MISNLLLCRNHSVFIQIGIFKTSETALSDDLWISIQSHAYYGNIWDRSWYLVWEAICHKLTSIKTTEIFPNDRVDSFRKPCLNIKDILDFNIMYINDQIAFCNTWSDANNTIDKYIVLTTISHHLCIGVQS